jgi:hypothetical protein
MRATLCAAIAVLCAVASAHSQPMTPLHQLMLLNTQIERSEEMRRLERQLETAFSKTPTAIRLDSVRARIAVLRITAQQKLDAQLKADATGISITLDGTTGRVEYGSSLEHFHVRLRSELRTTIRSKGLSWSSDQSPLATALTTIVKELARAMLDTASANVPLDSLIASAIADRFVAELRSRLERGGRSDVFSDNATWMASGGVIGSAELTNAFADAISAVRNDVASALTSAEHSLHDVLFRAEALLADLGVGIATGDGDTEAGILFSSRSAWYRGLDIPIDFLAFVRGLVVPEGELPTKGHAGVRIDGVLVGSTALTFLYSGEFAAGLRPRAEYGLGLSTRIGSTVLGFAAFHLPSTDDAGAWGSAALSIKGASPDSPILTVGMSGATVREARPLFKITYPVGTGSRP